MPIYQLHIAADVSGTSRVLNIEARTPWLAIERASEHIGAFGADLFAGKRYIGHVDRLPVGRQSVWQISTSKRD